MPVLMVRNNQKGPTVIASDQKGSDAVEWQGAGDPMGNDVQYVPELYAEHPAFMRAVTRGILTIEKDASSPEVVAAFERQRESWDQRQALSRETAKGSLDQVKQDDIVTVRCLGPDSRGQGQCENLVPVKERDKGDKPALCSMHSDLAAQFVPEDLTSNGRSERQWVRVTMGRRLTQD